MTGSASRLEKLGQLVFLVMCLAITVAALQYVSAARAAVNPRKPDPVQRGTRLSLPGSVTADSTRPSLLLVLSANCRYCTESMPFYKRLAELSQVRTGNLRLGVVSLQPADDMRKYLSAHGLGIESVITVPESGFNVMGTPTLVLVRRDGVVQRSWGGWLNGEEEKTVVASINDLVQ